MHLAAGVPHHDGGRRSLPGAINMASLGIPQKDTSRGRTDNEGGDAEGADAAGLRVLLLHARDVARQVLYAHLLVQGQPVALRLHPRCGLRSSHEQNLDHFQPPTTDDRDCWQTVATT